MTIKARPSTYQVLVYVAYGFYILLGLVWFLLGFMNTPGKVNPFAFFIMLAFGLQTYYRHLLTNLILGIIGLFFSIFMMLLPALNMALQPAAKGSALPLMLVSVASVAFSGILIFSYLKLNFKD